MVGPMNCLEYMIQHLLAGMGLAPEEPNRDDKAPIVEHTPDLGKPHPCHPDLVDDWHHHD